MKKARKFKFIKIFLITFYVLILLLYISLIFGKYIFNDSRSDFNFFGNSFYVLETNDAALVSYNSKPMEGDTVIIKKNNNVKIATLKFDVDKKSSVVTINANGSEEYVTVSSNNIFFVENTLPIIGGAYLFMASIWGCLIIVILPCMLFVIYLIVKIIKLAKSKNDLRESDFSVKDVSNANDEKLKNKDLNNKLDEVDKDDCEKQNDLVENTSDKLIEKKSMDDILKNIEYKINFQDTHKLQGTHDNISKITSKSYDSEFDLSTKYELKTKNIENGIEFFVNPEHIENLKLVLKTDGSLTVTTDKYIANIELNI